MPLPPAEVLSANIQWCSGSRHWAPKETFGGFKVCYQCRYMLQQRRRRLRDRKRLEKQKKLEQLQNQQEQEPKIQQVKPLPIPPESPVIIQEQQDQNTCVALNAICPDTNFASDLMNCQTILYGTSPNIDQDMDAKLQEAAVTITATDIDNVGAYLGIEGNEGALNDAINPLYMYQFSPSEYTAAQLDGVKIPTPTWLPQPLQPSYQLTAVNNYQLNTPDFSANYSEFLPLSPHLLFSNSPLVFNVGSADSRTDSKAQY